jgi:glycosyltransferase involved in cell wall biosynthesis
MRMCSIVHVIDSVAEEASGPSYSVPRLCEALARNGDRVRLLSLGEPDKVEAGGYSHDRFYQDWTTVPVLARLRASHALYSALTSLAPEVDVIHAHGLWLMSNVYPAWVAKRSGKPLIVSPRGMLGAAALQFSRWRKRAFWLALQAAALRSASCLHATSDAELADIRAAGLWQPVAVIPNGIDVPERGTTKRPSDRSRTVLFLGRIHPKKGIDSLLAAWAAVEGKHPDWRLEIVGPLEGDYAGALERIIANKRLARARLAGPLYGADKFGAYAEADLFVLPTLNENFAMTVAEALAQGTPVISTKGAPWQGLEQHGCGWWIDHGVDALATTLDRAMNLERDRLAEMGTAGRVWMQRDFSWTAIAREMSSVYGWLAGRGQRPSSVIAE